MTADLALLIEQAQLSRGERGVVQDEPDAFEPIFVEQLFELAIRGVAIIDRDHDWLRWQVGAGVDVVEQVLGSDRFETVGPQPRELGSSCAAVT